MFRFGFVALLLSGLAFVPRLNAQELPLAASLSVSGDSISRGFNADDRLGLCTFGDQIAHNWATGKDNGGNLCAPGPDQVFSHRERLECGLGRALGGSAFNDARSGATMIGDFFQQATAIRHNLIGAPSPRYVPVFLGHNDACTGTRERETSDCGSPDFDPSNYCRTTPAAFEREFRRGMDQLIQIPNARILIGALARISVLCNVGHKPQCAGLLSCSEFWSLTGAVCASLTTDCSDQRKIDMYNTTLAYNEILRRVTAEYGAIPEGEPSPTGARKANDVLMRYVDGSFFFKFQPEHISCCDCFHPNLNGQAVAARALWEGIQCSADSPCCADTGDALTDSTCEVIDTNTTYSGGFWATVSP